MKAERPVFLPCICDDITSVMNHSGREPARFFAETLLVVFSVTTDRGSVVVTVTDGADPG